MADTDEALWEEQLKKAGKPGVRVAVFAIALVATLCGCAAGGNKPTLLPLTNANLQAAGKKCHMNGVGLLGPNTIWVSGLHSLPDEPDYDAQVACLKKLIEVPGNVVIG